MPILLIFAGVFILLFMARLYVHYFVRHTEQRFPPQGSFIDVRGIRMHFLSKGQGRPVVFIHGGFGSLQDFHLSLFPFLPGNIRAIAFDRLGHGYSQRPAQVSVTLDDQVEYLHEALNQLEIKKPLLVGHSLGAAAILHYALKYPAEVSGLLLISPYVKPWTGPTNPMHTLAAVPVLGAVYLKCLVPVFGLFMKNGIGDKVFFPDAPPGNYMEVSTALAMRPSHFAANAEDIRNFRATLRPNWKRYYEIKLPVMIVTGDQDQVAPLNRHSTYLAEQIPLATLIVLKNTGHQPSFVRTDDVLKALETLIEKTGHEILS